MMATQPPFHRKPLQPKNQYATTTRNLVPEISFSNKENVPPLYSSTPVKKEIGDDDDDDALLAEKLKTEKVLRERWMMLDLEMKEMVKRGEIQKQLELEVDRLYRLKEINIACMVSLDFIMKYRCIIYEFEIFYNWVGCAEGISTSITER